MDELKSRINKTKEEISELQSRLEKITRRQNREMKREKIWELKKNAELKEKVQYIGLVHILEWKKNQNKTENEVESTLNCKSNQQERKNSLLRNEVP